MSTQGSHVEKSELLHWLRQEVQQWEEFLAPIDPAHMNRPGVNGEWSMKDMIAHLTGWNCWLVARLQAAHHGEPKPSPPWPAHLQSEDDINAWIYASNRERSVREVLDEMQQTYRRLRAAVEALPDDVCIERVEPAYDHVWVGDERFLVGEFFHHYHDEHERDVSAWLARETTGPNG